MNQNLFPTRTTIVITLTTPGEFTMTLTTVTFTNQNLLSRWGRNLQRDASLHLRRARSTLQNLRNTFPRPAKSSSLPLPAPGIAPIVEYGQKVSKLRKIRKQSSRRLAKREKIRSELRKATYTRHHSAAAKSKLTICESGQDFWQKIKATAQSEAKWERKMASIYKEIFSLQMQERELVEAVCFLLSDPRPFYYSLISGRLRIFCQNSRNKTSDEQGLIFVFLLAGEA